MLVVDLEALEERVLLEATGVDLKFIFYHQQLFVVRKAAKVNGS